MALKDFQVCSRTLFWKDKVNSSQNMAALAIKAVNVNKEINQSYLQYFETS